MRRTIELTFQAFIDDSSEGDIAVLAGHVATTAQWGALAAEWERLLPSFGTLKGDGSYHFKMAEMAILEERMERVAAFYRVIEAHVGFSVSVWLRRSDMESAFDEARMANEAIRSSVRPFDILAMALMSMLATQQPEIAKHVPLDLPIDFYFDEQSEKRPLLESWEDAVAAQGEEFGRAIVRIPKFENDADFLQLQAADLWAWWVRKWMVEGRPEQLERPDFGRFAAVRNRHLKLHLQVTQEQMTQLFKSIMLRHNWVG